MFASLRAPTLALIASFSLAACTNDGYGYGGMSVGYGVASPSYYGWYDGYYYPGTGYYVYDRDRRRHQWSDNHRRYWEARRQTFRGADARDRRELRSNWRGFRQDRRVDDRAFRQERRDDRSALRRGEVSREQFRTDRRADRRGFRQELRQDRRELRRENRRDRND